MYEMFCASDFQAFSFHGTHKLLKFCGTPKNTYVADLTKKIGIVLIHSRHAAIVVLAVVIFVLRQSKGKEVSAPD